MPLLLLLIATTLCVGASRAQQAAPKAANARILLLPSHIVSGERATLAVLDVNGRLTPDVRVIFSNGDKVTTDATGRGRFVAPLDEGVIFAEIAGRPGRVYTTILHTDEAAGSGMAVLLAPRIASLSDRFEVSGHGFCGDADSNHVKVGGLDALVLAASPNSLTILPPLDLEPGATSIEIACGQRSVPAFAATFLSLALEANGSALSPGEHRTLTVRVHGTQAKVPLEARNLAPAFAQLTGGNSMRVASSGGGENVAHFEVVGRQRGKFIISIRLVSASRPPETAGASAP